MSLSEHHHVTSTMLRGTVDLTAGSVGAIAGVLVGQPLDTVKVKMQAYPARYPGLLLCMRHTISTDGWLRGLYAGTVPALAANIAENSVLFCAYGFCQQLVASVFQPSSNNNSKQPHDQHREVTVLGSAVAGFLAAFFSSFSLCPTELVKCRLQSLQETAGARVGASQLTRDIVRAHGVAGLFRGLGATMAREMPGYFFFFGGYELSRRMVADRLYGGDCSRVGPLATVAAGGMGGMALWVAVFPADVAKSRIQISGERVSVWKMIARVAYTDGVMALYNGLAPTLLRTFPASGVMFLGYEWTRSLLLPWC